MKEKRWYVYLLVILLVFLATACNLLDLLSLPNSEESAPSELLDDAPVVEEEISESPTLAPSDTPEPTPEPPPAVWILAAADQELLYLAEGETEIKTASPRGYIVSVSPAPAGGKVAVVSSESEYGTGELWLYLLDLHTGEWTAVTALTNSETTFISWEDDAGMEARDANIATTYSEPVWTPDGSAVIFISAHEGKFAKPFTFHVDTGELHDLPLSGESHYYDLKISPDGQFVVAPSAFAFGTGAGYSMDQFSVARVDGGEARVLFDASYSIDIRTWGWMDSNTIVLSDVSIMAGPKNLRTLNIVDGTEQNIVKDFITDVAVATGQGSVMFTSVMGELLDYVEPQQIAESGLYSWGQTSQSLQKLNDFAENSSWVAWDVHAQCFYADLPRRFTENEDEILAFTTSGTMGNDCVAINPVAQDIPQVSTSGVYYAFSNLVFQAPEMNAFYVQGFAQSEATKLADGAVYVFGWHPEKDTLLYFDNQKVFTAAAPDFLLQQVMDTPASVMFVDWVNP